MKSEITKENAAGATVIVNGSPGMIKCVYDWPLVNVRFDTSKSDADGVCVAANTKSCYSATEEDVKERNEIIKEIGKFERCGSCEKKIEKDVVSCPHCGSWVRNPNTI